MILIMPHDEQALEYVTHAYLVHGHGVEQAQYGGFGVEITRHINHGTPVAKPRSIYDGHLGRKCRGIVSQVICWSITGAGAQLWGTYLRN